MGSAPPPAAGALTVSVADAVTPLVTPVAVMVYVPGAVGAVNLTVAVDGAGCITAPTPPAVHVAEMVAPASVTLTVSPVVQPVSVAVNEPPGATVDGVSVSEAATGGYGGEAAAGAPKSRVRPTRVVAKAPSFLIAGSSSSAQADRTTTGLIRRTSSSERRMN